MPPALAFLPTLPYLIFPFFPCHLKMSPNAYPILEFLPQVLFTGKVKLNYTPENVELNNSVN